MSMYGEMEMLDREFIYRNQNIACMPMSMFSCNVLILAPDWLFKPA